MFSWLELIWLYSRLPWLGLLVLGWGYALRLAVLLLRLLRGQLQVVHLLIPWKLKFLDFDNFLLI